MEKSDSKYDPDDKTALPKLPSGAVCGNKVFQKIVSVYYGLRILTFIAVGAAIAALFFNRYIPNFIALPVVTVLGLARITGSLAVFFKNQLSKLGLVTEICCVFGVVLMLTGAGIEIWVLTFSGIFLAFGVAPLLGIINRSLRLMRKQSGNVAFTVVEIVIYSVAVIVTAYFTVHVLSMSL